MTRRGLNFLCTFAPGMAPGLAAKAVEGGARATTATTAKAAHVRVKPPHLCIILGWMASPPNRKTAPNRKTTSPNRKSAAKAVEGGKGDDGNHGNGGEAASGQ